MSLFRLDASIRVDGSTSREIADVVEEQWQANHPGDAVVRRNVGVDVLPADAWNHALEASAAPEESHTPEQRAATALAATLVDELLEAETILLTTPMYNFGVSQHLKAWIDLVITDPRAAPGGAPLLAGKQAVLVAVRGGSYAPGTPRAGWDHATDYLRRILADFWQAELTVVERELTLVGVNPALDSFTELAAESYTEALRSARAAGKALGAG